MFTIMLWLEGKNELRVIRRDSIFLSRNGLACDHHSGHPLLLTFPPGVSSLEELPLFDDADAAWRSIRADYCPSLHP